MDGSVPRRYGGGAVNKNSLVAEVAKQTGQSKTDVARVVDAAISTIRETVSAGERVSLVGFGSFEKRRRARRVARNPHQPDVAIPVPARDVPTFVPGTAFREETASKRKRAPAKRTRR
ncbi:MAG TPA: HU family DNA-binding protein [Actinomycetota bacterium]